MMKDASLGQTKLTSTNAGKLKTWQEQKEIDSTSITPTNEILLI
jgi:hypothetical protein